MQIRYWGKAAFPSYFNDSEKMVQPIFHWKKLEWVEWWPPKRDIYSQIPETCEYYLIWGKKWVFADIIKDLEMRSSWIIQVFPKSSEKCTYQKQKGRIHKHTEEKVMWRERQRLEWCCHSRRTCGATGSWKSKGMNSRASRGSAALQTRWFQTWPSNCVRTKFCCFQLPDLRWFVTLATGN